MAAKKKSAISMENLEVIINAGINGINTPKTVYEPLMKAGLVEINTETVSENGDAVARATAEGIAEFSKSIPDKSVGDFMVVSGIPVPEQAPRSGRRSGSIYPFDSLEIGQAFFVPNTEKKPDAVKSMASAVSGAIARNSVKKTDESGNVIMKTVKVKRYQKGEDGKLVKGEDGKWILLGEDEVEKPETVKTKDFIIRSVEDGAPWGEQYAGKPGAGIWRTM